MHSACSSKSTVQNIRRRYRAAGRLWLAAGFDARRSRGMAHFRRRAGRTAPALCVGRRESACTRTCSRLLAIPEAAAARASGCLRRAVIERTSTVQCAYAYNRSELCRSGAMPELEVIARWKREVGDNRSAAKVQRTGIDDGQYCVGGRPMRRHLQLHVRGLVDHHSFGPEALPGHSARRRVHIAACEFNSVQSGEMITAEANRLHFADMMALDNILPYYPDRSEPERIKPVSSHHSAYISEIKYGKTRLNILKNYNMHI